MVNQCELYIIQDYGIHCTCSEKTGPGLMAVAMHARCKSDSIGWSLSFRS